MLISACTAFTACNNDAEDSPVLASNKLNITVGLQQPQGRAIITGTTLPNGSSIGILLDDGEATSYDAYNNIKFTAATENSKQVWNPASDIVLDETKGTLYAYYPYATSTNLTAIPVETASQTDYLYAEPVANVSEKNANVSVIMKHMLANVNVTVNKGTYVGTGNISKISIQSDGIATAGIFNAAQTIPAFTTTTGTGTAIEQTISTTLGNAIDIMVVPTGAAKPITFMVRVDDVDYTVTSSDVTLESGNSYNYTLSLNSTFMSVNKVAVTEWNSVTKENLTLEKKEAGGSNPGSGPTIDTTGKANGVYVVTAAGQLVNYITEDPTAIGVALITDNQKIMIEKMGEANTDIIKAAYEADGATNTDYISFYWGPYGTDIAGIENITGSQPRDHGFNGKAYTAAIIATPDSDTYTEYANMGTYCRLFNEAGLGYSDWYVPATGQLYEIFTYKTNINTALTNIGGTTLDKRATYWSSSELDINDGWAVTMDYGDIYNLDKNCAYYVRFIRDIE